MESDEALVPCLGFELIKFKPKGSPPTQDVEQIFPEIEPKKPSRTNMCKWTLKT